MLYTQAGQFCSACFTYLAPMSTPSLYGLIGYALEHSYSPAYFKKKFADEQVDAVYRAFPISKIQQLPELLEEYPDIKGLNVTIPYKEEVMAYMDDVDADAAIIKAVNCVKVIDGKRIGYNTDIIGFAKSLQPLLKPYMTKALILGSGGASKAAKFVLDRSGIEFKVVSRTGQGNVVTYADVTEEVIAYHHLIINTTPLGMYPGVESAPGIPYDALTDKHLLFDMVYNPQETTFMKNGVQKGATVKNGLEMLELQAEASWMIWNS